MYIGLHCAHLLGPEHAGRWVALRHAVELCDTIETDPGSGGAHREHRLSCTLETLAQYSRYLAIAAIQPITDKRCYSALSACVGWSGMES